VKPSPFLSGVLAALALSLPVTGQVVKVDPGLPSYRAVQGVSGNIKSVGSDTMNNLLALWGEGFKSRYPNVQIEVEGKGSSTAPPALIAGKASFGPMSRGMKQAELDDFKRSFGYEPTPLPTSIDMLAVYVNKDNPLPSLTLAQVDAVFSKSRNGGLSHDIRGWSELGLEGAWGQRSISLYGRNSASGTYGYFKQHALFKGDYKDSVKEQPGSSAVVQGVATDRFAMGYSGIGYKTADVRAVPLAFDAASTAVPATPEHAYTGEYPLARFLQLYVNKQPGAALEPLRREFLLYIFSKQGQQDVVKAGYFPVSAAIAREALSAVELELPAKAES